MSGSLCVEDAGRRPFQQSDEFDFENLNIEALNISESAIDIERLLDICGEDIMLISDVLDTFCVQGRDRVESLETACQQYDIRQAIFDGVSLKEIFSTVARSMTTILQMFLLGAAKNVGADPLSQSVEFLLDRLKLLSGASFLADETTVSDIGAGKN
jgi:hypothetical protein